ATQFAGEFGVNDLSQDGYASGRLNGIDVSDTGVVFARFTNGRSTSLGKVVLAKFNNPNGLGKEGDNNWTETFESGDAQLGEANTASFGTIQSGALELSNVDIATQLVKLIVAQRNFQANTKVISTADQVTQAVINIR
ncbi:MAG: flagellar hook-basal body complex protein, partial [Sedimenticola sp.]